MYSMAFPTTAFLKNVHFIALGRTHFSLLEVCNIMSNDNCWCKICVHFHITSKIATIEYPFVRIPLLTYSKNNSCLSFFHQMKSLTWPFNLLWIMDIQIFFITTCNIVEVPPILQFLRSVSHTVFVTLQWVLPIPLISLKMGVL